MYINKSIESEKPHLHAHDFLEIAYVASGNGIHIIGENEYTVSKGNLFIINYNVPHEFRSIPNSNAKLVIYNCTFQPEFLNNSLVGCKDFSDVTNNLLFKTIFPEEVESPVDINLMEYEYNSIQNIYEKMHREYVAMIPGYIELLRAYIIELLISVFRIFNSSNKLKDPIENSRNLIIEKAILYLKNNYTKDIKLDDLSMMSFLSKNYFCKIFKDCTGLTVFEYAQNIRIEEACKLLKNTDKKVIEIAMSVGYKDLKFFNKVFKRYTAITPSEYRNRK
jgi:YesN/AraC family two-component response regulator